MKYLSTFETAEKWKISPRRILNLIKSGRIPEAKLIGSRWVIPENFKKPNDGRTKAGKAEKQNESYNFRYPIFEFKNVSSFNPPLSEEELTVKTAIEMFNGCRFNDAEKLLSNLPETAENRYTRITALHCGCMIDIALCNTGRFFNRYGQLKAELAGDFPHKAEMSEYLYEIDAILGSDEYYSNEFNKKTAYCYHESFLPRLCNLSALRLVLGNNRITSEDLTPHEANCAFLEKTDNYFDLQALHVYLACAYSMLDKKDECCYHFRRAFSLAEKYEMFFTIANMQYYYMPKMFKYALEGFSEDFKNKITKCNRDIHKSHIRFTNAIHFDNIYKLITGNDYIYIVFAVQGLTHAKVAERMHVSVGTVGKRYTEIYAQLGVKNKVGLIELYHRIANKTNANEAEK